MGVGSRGVRRGVGGCYVGIVRFKKAHGIENSLFFLFMNELLKRIGIYAMH